MSNKIKRPTSANGQERAELKERFLAYYAKLPIKRYAAASVGKSEDTAKRWEEDDAEFAERIEQLRAEYLMAKTKQLPATFIVPLLFRELTPRQEITGKDGKDLPTPIIPISQHALPRDNSDKEDLPA